MTNEDIAVERIKMNIKGLNEAIAIALSMGIETKISTTSFRQIGCCDREIVEAKIFKSL